MRKEISKALKQQFGERMAAQAPAFAAAKVKSRFVSARELVFRRVAGDLHQFVIVVPKDNGESFAVELAWSRLARFPELGIRPSIGPVGPGDAEGAVRLREVVEGRDTWWDVVPMNVLDPASVTRYLNFQITPLDEAEAGRLVEPPVRDAIRLVVEAGVPYLDRIAQAG